VSCHFVKLFFRHSFFGCQFFYINVLHFFFFLFNFILKLVLYSQTASYISIHLRSLEKLLILRVFISFLILFCNNGFKFLLNHVIKCVFASKHSKRQIKIRFVFFCFECFDFDTKNHIETKSCQMHWNVFVRLVLQF
jgi:hypothetical protein